MTTITHRPFGLGLTLLAMMLAVTTTDTEDGCHRGLSDLFRRWPRG